MMLKCECLKQQQQQQQRSVAAAMASAYRRVAVRVLQAGSGAELYPPPTPWTAGRHTAVVDQRSLHHAFQPTPAPHLNCGFLPCSFPHLPFPPAASASAASAASRL